MQREEGFCHGIQRRISTLYCWFYFLVLTITSNEILPIIYFGISIISETLKVFNAKMYTQTLPSISIKELADLEITVPDLETQNNIVHLDQLKNKN